MKGGAGVGVASIVPHVTAGRNSGVRRLCAAAAPPCPYALRYLQRKSAAAEFPAVGGNSAAAPVR